jgi:predicted ATPase/class 3 adenylate cyclase
VTFLRTDVEGSMGLIRVLGPGWDEVNAAHLAILREAVRAHDGVVVRTEGDAMFAAFPEAIAAAGAAVDAQRALSAHPWPAGGRVRVRMGLHSGEAHLAGDDYGGFDVNRAARIAAVGHGGQIVVSGTTHALVADGLGAGISFRDLGRHALRDVPTPEQLFQLDAPGCRTDFPPLRVAGSATGNLPTRVTSFVGRSADLVELEGLLDEHRLVTLTGPGGIGKTSLAVELARARVGAFADGAWLVALDTVADPAMVGTAIARTLGLFDGAERQAVEALPGFVAGRSLLLVLDNFEHLLGAAAEVPSLLRASPLSRVVVTSRAPLRVAGEQEYPVRPLSAATVGDALGSPAARDAEDGADGSGPEAATRLFIERARAVRPGWEPGHDAPLVAETCALLDGLPLGIELAAARLSLLPVRAIRDRLAAHLPLPGSGPRDAPARQRTLEGAIEWSHDLLAPTDQAVLHDLAVFDGSFDAEQAGRVVGPQAWAPAASGDAGEPDGVDVVDRLVTLAEQSLVARAAPPSDDALHVVGSGIRFGMLKTVQAFAAAKLVLDGRDAEVRRRHVRAFVELAEAVAPHLNTARQPAALDRLAPDAANLQAALHHASASGDADSALRLVGALWRYWLLEGRLAEGAEWVTTVFALPGADEPTPARLSALAAAGGIAYWRGHEGTSALYEAQRELAERLADPAALADANYNLASMNYVLGDMGSAVARATEARRGYEALGDEIGVNRVDWGFSNMLQMQGDTEGSIRELGRVLARAEVLGDPAYVALAAGSLAWIAFAEGDAERARPWALRSMRTYYAIRDFASTAISLPVGARMALASGRPRDAATVMGAFEGLCERFGVRPPLGLSSIISDAEPLERTRAVLDDAALADAVERGRRMSLAEAMELIADLGDEVSTPPAS